MAEVDGIKRGNRFKDITGLVVGRLTVICFAGINPRSMWRCRCECGKECEVATKYLTSGRTVSCGCVRAEKASTLAKTHGKSKRPEHKVWKKIRQRCTNESNLSFPNYGGRGIKMCSRWLNSFEAFIEDMGERPSRDHSIERIDNDGDYEPSNCIWATKDVQSRNTRRTVFVVYRGERHKLCDLCDSRGMRTATVRSRIKSGWGVERAIDTPIGGSCADL